MPERPNVLFLLSDEHAYRHMSAVPQSEGGEPVRTPTLDALAASGTWLTNAYCQMPLCTPSRMCMLTGREVEDCGAWTNGSILRPEIPTLGSVFRAAGYGTCLAGKLHFGGRRQLGGFEHRPYGDFGGMCSHQFDPLDVPDAGMGMRSRTRDAGVSQIPESLLQERTVVEESVAWIREHTSAEPGRPWLLNASFSRPHFPLTAPRRHFDRYWPEGVTRPRISATGDAARHPMTQGMAAGFRVDEIDDEEMMRARAAYFACVDTLDEILGDFLCVLDRDGLLDNTVVVYTTDHGEMCGEHGLWWKNSWHEAATRVPFIIRTPQQRAGGLTPRRVTDPVSLADLLPTLCGLCDVPEPDGVSGTDLTRAILGEGPASQRRRPVTCQVLWPRWGEGTEFRMVVEGDLKYVAFRDAPDLMFDLAEDPFEQMNLAGSHADAGRLKDTALADFSFDEAEERRLRDEAELPEQYRLPVKPSTPNQIVLGDGRLVEADAPLYSPQVVTDRIVPDLEVSP
jgi:choline-sulfatase